MLFIGIDLGTSSVKLLLMKSGGEILRTVTEEYPVYFPQSGWSEQDPEEWYNGTVKGIAKLLDGFDGKEVGGIVVFFDDVRVADEKIRFKNIGVGEHIPGYHGGRNVVGLVVYGVFKEFDHGVFV